MDNKSGLKFMRTININKLISSININKLISSINMKLKIITV